MGDFAYAGPGGRSSTSASNLRKPRLSAPGSSTCKPGSSLSTPKLLNLLDSHGPPKDPASYMFWEAINNASTIAREDFGKHIPGLKWGRVDFLTEIELTSRWMLFK